MIKFVKICIALLTIADITYAQQSGNYTSEIVEARTWSRDKERKILISDWKPFETRLIDNFTDLEFTNSKLGKYGGDITRKFESTGFFRVEKIDKRWWVIDPDGHPNMHIAVNSINTGKSGRNKKAFNEKFKNDTEWIIQTAKMLESYGFNGTGSWSDTDAILKANTELEKPMVYTINWNFMSAYADKRGGTYQEPGHKAYPNGTIFVFDSEFERFCNERAKDLGKFKDDPNLYGYFSDNEMPLSIKNLEGYLTLPDKNDPGYIAANKWMKEKGITLQQITDQHREEFLSFVSNRYFSIVTNAIKKYDKNHMYLGCRFYAAEKNIASFMKTAGKYLDVVTINYYGSWTPIKKQLDNWANWTGKPFMITEFYTKGEDSGLANTSGAGWIVKTQEDRGKAYQNFCLALLESKSCVGWHWFKYQDNDPTQEDAEPSNIDANKGFIDNYYNIYKPMAEKMRQLNLDRYQLIKYFDAINK